MTGFLLRRLGGFGGQSWRQFRILVGGAFFGSLGVVGIVIALLLLDRGNESLLERSARKLAKGEARDVVSEPKLPPLELVGIEPTPGASIKEFEIVRLYFSRPIATTQSLQLTANDRKPLAIDGTGRGPYQFRFPKLRDSTLNLKLSGNVSARTSSAEDAQTMDRTWEYQVGQGLEAVISSVFFRDKALLSDDAEITSEGGWWITIENKGGQSIDTLGWRVICGAAAAPLFVLPQRVIEPGEISEFELTGVQKSEELGVVGPFGMKGVISLYDSSLPANLLDALSFEKSPGYSRGITLRRIAPEGRNGLNPRSDGAPRKEPAMPVPDLPSGNYSSPIQVKLVPLEGSEEIWFTLDGSIPNRENGKRYHQPITVGESMVIRAVAYAESDRSPVGTYSYTLGEGLSHEQLPVLELVTADSGKRPRQPTTSATIVTGEVEQAVVFWRQGEGARMEFEGELRAVHSLTGNSKRDAGSFSVRLSRWNGAASERFDPGCQLHSGEWFDCRPAFDSGGMEMIDALIREVSSIYELRRAEVGFVNLIENGVTRGLYRLTPAREEPRLSARENGPPLIISGSSSEWGRVYSAIIDLDLANDDSYSRIWEQFDVPAFCRYYLAGMFWGDPGWPGRGESVFQDEVSGRWSFELFDQVRAGSLWSDSETFTSVTKHISATGRIFDALWRSSAFRDELADQAAYLFQSESPEILGQIGAVRARLESELGSRVRRRLERFAPSEVEGRLRQFWAYLDRLGVSRRIDRRDDGKGFQRLYASNTTSVDTPLRSNLDSLSREVDHWLITRDSRMRVWIPTSDRAADWNQPGFDDHSWPESNGLFGFDSKGLSGELFDSGFQELVFNRSTGAYFRVPFELKPNDIESLGALVLRCRINDGFVAYLNGVEIQRFNVPEPLRWNSVAAGDVRGSGWRFREFDVSSFRQHLKPGKNLLAVHAVNSMINGPSFFFNVELRSVERSVPPEQSPDESERIASSGRDHEYRLNHDGQWSPPIARYSGETAQNGDVRIGSVYLRDERGKRLEFLSLHCQSEEPVWIRSVGVGRFHVRLGDHRWFQPGEVAYLVSEGNAREFRTRWPSRRLLGSFSGHLAGVDDVVVWGDKTVLDQAPLDLGSYAYIPGQMLGLERGQQSGLDAGWGRIKGDDESVPNESWRDLPTRVESVKFLEETDSSSRSLEARISGVGNEGSIWLEVRSNDRSLRQKVQRRRVGPGDRSVITVKLGRNDELIGPLSVLLLDGVGNRLDGFSLGTPKLSGEIRRASRDEAWQLETAAEEGEVGRVGKGLVVVNELLLRRRPELGGGIEFFNSSITRPIDISGFALSIGDSPYLLPYLSVIPPRGYLALRLPDSLITQFGLMSSDRSWTVMLKDGERLVDELVLPVLGSSPQISFGRWPDARGQAMALGERATLGGPNILVRSNPGESAVTLSEVTADNQESFGGSGDWLELHNSSERLVDLSGMSLSIGRPLPLEWEFPAGAHLFPEGFLFLRADASSLPSREVGTRMNIGRSLEARGDAIYLFDRESRQIDAIEFGPQLPDRSLVRTSPAEWSLSSRPSPGGRNRAPVRINQFPILSISSGEIPVGASSLSVTLRNETSETVWIDGWRLVGIAGGAIAGENRLPNWSVLEPGGALELDLAVDATMGDYLNECQLRNPQGRLIARIPIGRGLSSKRSIR